MDEGAGRVEEPVGHPIKCRQYVGASVEIRVHFVLAAQQKNPHFMRADAEAETFGATVTDVRDVVHLAQYLAQGGRSLDCDKAK